MILVFKTTIQLTQEQFVKYILSEIKEVQMVTIDFEDCDYILRIVATREIGSRVEKIMRFNNIDCTELN